MPLAELVREAAPRRRFVVCPTGWRIFVTSLAALAVSGCQHADLAQRRIDQRWAKVGATLKELERNEADRPRKLAEAFEFIGREIEADARELNEDFVELGKLIEADFERWERRQPDYARELLRILRGKPEDIEKTAIDLFY